MKNSDLIKLKIARTLKEMTEKQSLKSITVSSLCKHCKINRGTFYYHFLDLYDLIIWIFEVEVIQPLETYLLKNEFGSWRGMTNYCLQQMLKSRKFYCQSIKIEGQNNLKEYMQKRTYDCWKIFTNKYISVISNKCLHSDEYLEFLIKYTSQAMCNMVIAWAAEGMTIPINVMNQMDDVATKGIYGVVDYFR